MYLLTVSQAVARLVAQFSRAEDELRSEFAKQKDDRAALTRALHKALRAGLTYDMSDVVRKVQDHLRQVISCSYVCHMPRLGSSITRRHTARSHQPFRLLCLGQMRPLASTAALRSRLKGTEPNATR